MQNAECKRRELGDYGKHSFITIIIMNMDYFKTEGERVAAENDTFEFSAIWFCV